jgi:Methyltransferase FkbM domain
VSVFDVQLAVVVAQGTRSRKLQVLNKMIINTNSKERSARRSWCMHSTERTKGNKVSSRYTFSFTSFCTGFVVSSFLHFAFDRNRHDYTANRILESLIDNVSYVSTSEDDGWNMIHVFIGMNESKIEHMIDASAIPNDYFYTTRWFSQLRQDEVVFQILQEKKGGYFVDLAANDAIRISNTFALEHHHGWGGIVIEPNPIYWPGLAYRNCTVIAAVIGQQTGTAMKFKFPKSTPAPKGGLVGQTFDNHGDGGTSDEDVMRYTVTLLDIFKKFNTPKVIDYFSLDIEGAETFVMEAFPFDQYRFNVLTVERADERLQGLLQQNGYTLLKQLKDWGETIWIHSSLFHDTTLTDMTALEIDTENYKYREKVKKPK